MGDCQGGPASRRIGSDDTHSLLIFTVSMGFRTSEKRGTSEICDAHATVHAPKEVVS